MEHTVEQLRVMLRKAEEAQRNVGQAEFKSLPKVFEWRLTPEPKPKPAQKGFTPKRL